MSWADVFSGLAAWTITGVTMRDLDEIPEVAAAADCPMMFPVPRGFYGSRGEPQGFTTGKIEDSMVVDHICLYKPQGLGMGAREIYPALIALMDLYVSELAGDPTVGGYCSQKAVILDKEFPLVDWAGRKYWGFQYVLRLTLRL
jgi:hypothetical protein